VVGYEELISAEAGSRAALSAGARVEHVTAGRLDAAALAGEDRSVPVVVAGATAVRDEVCALLSDAGVPVTPAANVLPDIGHLLPG
jgi:hypothetical protein